MTLLKDVKFLEKGPMMLYVFTSPMETASEQPAESICVPIMARKDGVMLAIPPTFLPEEDVEKGDSAAVEDLMGPSRLVTLPAMVEEEDGSERPLGTELEVLLIDFSHGILPFIRPMDPATEGEGILFFSAELPTALPSSSSLMAAATEWIQVAGDPRVLFYSAAEEEVEAPAKAPPAKKPVKRITTAALAEQVACCQTFSLLCRVS